MAELYYRALAHHIQDDIFALTAKASTSMCFSIDIENCTGGTDEHFFCANVDAIYSQCKDYVLGNAKELGIRVLPNAMEEVFKHPLKEYKRDNKSYVHLYAKLIINNNDSKVWTSFYDKEKKMIDYKALEKTHCLSTFLFFPACCIMWKVSSM